MDPHLFKMAEDAFQSMKSNSLNQEIIISGISGSGKTEAAKLMLAYLANACNNFKYMETGDQQGQFDDSITESDSEDDGGKGDLFDEVVSSNRQAVSIDLRQSEDLDIDDLTSSKHNLDQPHPLDQPQTLDHKISSKDLNVIKRQQTRKLMRSLSIYDTKKTEDSLERRLLDANPILEAFGNSKTLANQNSSRFCKHTHLKFTEFGFVYCANIEAYLLEKSRVVHVPQGERNYHFFYYLLAMSKIEVSGDTVDPRLEKYQLDGDPRKFKILGDGPYDLLDFNGQAVDEKARFNSTLESLLRSGFSESEVEGICDVIVALLYLGNVNFDPNEEQTAHLISTTEIEKAASLLKVDPAALSQSLLKKVVKYPGQTIEVDHSRDEATNVLHSFIKSIYSRLFSQIVDRLNSGISVSRRETSLSPSELPKIGILDIFGFESYQAGHNSFEQLCINYANEKLQQQFNLHIFKLATELYENELPGEQIATIDFPDN